MSDNADTLLINLSTNLSIREDDDANSGSLSKGVARKRKGRGFQYDFRTVLNERHEKKVGSNDNDTDDESEQPPEYVCNPLKSCEGWILFVTNIHEEATDDDLEVLFPSFPRGTRIHRNLDRRTGFSKGYAIVEFGNYKEAETALLECDGAEILGKNISVNWCFVKEPIRKPKHRF